jgi:VWFA-related protein
MRSVVPSWLLVVGLALDGLGAEQLTPAEPGKAVPGAYRIPQVEVENVRLVLVPASVEDRKGRPVRGLSSQDFRLYDEGVPQTIRHFSVEAGQPVEVAFLLDLSGSMREFGKLEAAKEAIRHILSRLHYGDRVGLIGFADDQVRWITPFATDRASFLDRLSVQEGYGQSAIHDAVAAAPDLVRAAADGRKAIVLITDGVDNASRFGTAQALEFARQASVPIYAVGLSSTPRSLVPKNGVPSNLEILRVYAAETGGVLFPARDPDDLKEAAEQILEDLRYQYVIGYTPDPPVWDGGFRRLRVEPRQRDLAVRARSGYVATP